MVRRLLVGLLKGIVIGGAIGALLHFALGLTALPAAWLGYVLYGAVAALGGVLAGQPPWRKGAWVASILKGLFGFGLGALAYLLGSRFLNLDVGGLANIANGTTLANAPLLFAPIVAMIYAGLVELDDGGEQAAAEEAAAKTGVRAVPDVDSIDVGEEEPAERGAKKSGRAGR